jgi:hypothetical protein
MVLTWSSPRDPELAHPVANTPTKNDATTADALVDRAVNMKVIMRVLQATMLRSLPSTPALGKNEIRSEGGHRDGVLLHSAARTRSLERGGCGCATAFCQKYDDIPEKPATTSCRG